ncbi:MAG: DUF1887 family protein [Peptococcaceae bacterium]|nr:DUF1887 family protein [Peptococcaceae bacterium]
MVRVMVALVGEQPIPNLLPVRHLKPMTVHLVCTERTEKVAGRLESLIRTASRVNTQKVEPYDVDQIYRELKKAVEDSEPTEEILFNLTGGTKLMSIAAFRLASEKGSPFLYLETEGKKSRLYFYRFDRPGQPSLCREEILPTLINIDDYLKAHVGEYHYQHKKNEFEDQVYAFLKDELSGGGENEIDRSIKIGGAVEIDLVIRCRNQVGIAEVKSGNKATKKRGIEQLSAAGGREYLGTYTKKFLIIDRNLGEGQSNIRDLAKARDINLIEMPSFSESKTLSKADREKCLGIIRRELMG